MPTTTHLVDVLQQFGFELMSKKANLSVLKFEVITPDSFMWRLLINDNVYYVYLEDYIPDLEYVKTVCTAYLESDKWEFVDPIDVSDEAIEHAVKSGYDSAFLIKSAENADDARFSKHVPRGFKA